MNKEYSPTYLCKFSTTILTQDFQVSMIEDIVKFFNPTSMEVIYWNDPHMENEENVVIFNSVINLEVLVTTENYSSYGTNTSEELEILLSEYVYRICSSGKSDENDFIKEVASRYTVM